MPRPPARKLPPAAVALLMALVLLPGQPVRAADPWPGVSDAPAALPALPSLFPLAPTAGPARPRIAVDLSQQQLIAFLGPTPVRAFPVSTGDAAHPTIVGHYAIRARYEAIDLIGVDYYYHDVPYVMEFARPFYIHAAPWRAEFGTAASRGCITLAPADAAWLFDWAGPGTPVEITW